MARRKKKTQDRTDIIINVDGTANWTINSHGPIKGLYTGLFKFKCYLSPLAQIAANKEYRELLGDNMTFADEHVSFVAYALTQLKQRIIDAPAFWSSTDSGMVGDIADDIILQEILTAAIDAEVKYKNILEERRIDALDRAKKAAEAALAKRKKEKEEELTS